MAVEYNGGVIIGADSRTSMGVYVANRVSDKLTKISDTIYCCRSGSSADTQATADLVKYNLNLHRSVRPMPSFSYHYSYLILLDSYVMSKYLDGFIYRGIDTCMCKECHINLIPSLAILYFSRVYVVLVRPCINFW